ncbi:PH domain-containing protein [Natronococcus pandeyae]|nr:PH domain-containing protein [Natronococcus pandeyae]
MVTLNEYHSIDDFDSKRREAIESLLYSDEQFIYGIDVYDAILLTGKRASKLVLTDQRVIEFKRGFIKENSKDYSLDEIASIEHKKGYVMRKITLQGHGFDEDYQTLEDFGRQFVTTVREQMHRNEEGLDPLTTADIRGEEGDVDGSGSIESSQSVSDGSGKFGSLKLHVVIALLTIWWTFGLGNLAYGGYKYYKFKR